MAELAEVEVTGQFKDDHTSEHSDSAERKKNLTFAQELNASVLLHTAYGGLDGASVVYSTVKLFCDLLSKDSKSYHENLEYVLTDFDFWLRWIGLGTIIIAGSALLSNRAAKLNESERTTVEKIAVAVWPYARDILKGFKNGYKGIKTLTGILVSLGLLDSKNFRSFLLPVGLGFAVAAVFNRVYLRSMKNERRDLIKKSADCNKRFVEYNKILLDIQLAYTELQSLEYSLVKDRLNGHLRNERKKLEIQIEELEKKLSTYDLKKIIADHQQARDNLQQFQQQNDIRLYISKAIGAIIDAPYLYLGLTTLTKLSPSSLLLMSYGLSFFFVACIAIRVNEEVEEQRKQNITIAQMELTQKIQAFTESQKQLSEKNLKHFKAFRERNPHLRGEELVKQYQEASKDIFKPEYDELHDLLLDIDQTISELKQLKRPSYKSAIINGIHDGLSAYGAVSSGFFAASIFLAFMGTTLPATLILSSMVFAFGAIASFVSYRIYNTYHELANFEKYFAAWKQKMEYDIIIEKEDTLLSPIDCNTDGLTKGEFYFQSIFEVVRNATNGPYKSQNLTDFVLTPYHDSGHEPEPTSWFTTLFWGGMTCVYGLCLTLRAYGQEFSKKKSFQAADPKEQTPKDATRFGVYRNASRSTFFSTTNALSPMTSFVKTTHDLSPPSLVL